MSSFVTAAITPRTPSIWWKVSGDNKRDDWDHWANGVDYDLL
jgi:hypothetical protein